VRENDKLSRWTIISVERQPTKQFQHFRELMQKLFQKREEFENPFEQHFEQSPTPHQEKYS